MNTLRFSIQIRATKERVWDTLWRDKTFRKWAGLIDPGTRMVGELKEGNEVQFISGNGYGVTSRVEKLVEARLLVLRHRADTKEGGKQEREKEWTGLREEYALAEKGGTTTLSVAFDVPPELEEYFRANYPKALEQVRQLAEARQS